MQRGSNRRFAKRRTAFYSVTVKRSREPSPYIYTGKVVISISPPTIVQCGGNQSYSLWRNSLGQRSTRELWHDPLYPTTYIANVSLTVRQEIVRLISRSMDINLCLLKFSDFRSKDIIVSLKESKKVLVSFRFAIRKRRRNSSKEFQRWLYMNIIFVQNFNLFIL